MSVRPPPVVTGFDAILGNMPFLGGRRIATQHGEDYAAWLTDVQGGTGGTDYVGYFFLRGRELVPERAAIGFIATDAIGDGDNRRTTLVPLVDGGFELYRAQTGLPWPGKAAVLVAVVHLARGEVAQRVKAKVFDSRTVPWINSRLRAAPERPDPLPLRDNDGCALVGCFLRGDGFLLSPEEADAHVREHPAEAAVVKPYLTGDDLNNRPDQRPSRHVITFWDMSLEEAQGFPASFRILEDRVRPQRMRLKTSGVDADHRKHWWRFANTRKELRERTTGLPRVLAAARVSKHVLFSFTSPDFVPSEQVVVFPLPSFTAFAVLQSRVHESWVLLVAGARGEGVRYSASECFDNFAFPVRDALSALSDLEAIGRLAYEARTAYTALTGIGLTDLYNRLKDASCSDPQIEDLRRLHEAMDRAVLSAYGWSDIQLPPFCSLGRSYESARDAFRDEVTDRLHVLNTERSSSETSPLRAGSTVRKAGSRAKPGIARAAEPKPRSRRRTGG